QIEFSCHSLQEASITNIVKLAEIRRGSFYQYFENKQDLYFYYFATLRKNSERHLEKQIIAENGDLIEPMDVYFSKMIV
ncbi:TetR/AcrR family transcriptional regulator, partial [Enterococcus faecalis]|uniref:TetR/AcrR family transcriptional regulator n=1 Tax=Enterococcus faecalis TaxID=1351 RepID=UPI003D6A8C31